MFRIILIQFLFCFVGSLFFLKNSYAQTAIYLEDHRSQINFSGGYYDFLKTRFNTENPVYFKGTAYGLVFQLDKKNRFLIRYATSKAALPFRGLSGESYENKFVLDSLLFAVQRKIYEKSFFKIEVSGGFGLERIQWEMYGFDHDNILASNINSVTGVDKNESQATIFNLGMTFCACIDPFLIGLSLNYQESSHSISLIETRSAHDERNISKDTELNIKNHITALFASFIF